MKTSYRLNTSHWHIQRLVFLMAGTITLLSIAASHFWHNEWFLILGAFVASAQIIFAVTGFCLSALIMDTLGIPRE